MALFPQLASFPLPRCQLDADQSPTITMSSVSLTDYIPLGCLRLDGLGTLPNLDLTAFPFGQWLGFSHGSQDPGPGPNETAYLDDDTQRALRRIPGLKPYYSLFGARWVYLQACFDSTGNSCLLRTYALPDDVHRILIPRNENRLRNLRRKMFLTLDYCSQAWNGDFESTPRGIPELATDTAATGGKEIEEETSLLRLFNEIPAPSPQLDSIPNLEHRDTMEDLVSCQVYGIKSTLYPYQGRSAALMVQREVSPGQVIDPRLRAARSQSDGRTYYHDAVTGVVLKEPRYYDGISGGILAEEMGTGKTLICLAVIAATKGRPVKTPEIYHDLTPKKRRKIGSLVDMAAASTTKNSVSWSHYFEFRKVEMGEDHDACVEAIGRNPGSYQLVLESAKRGSGWGDGGGTRNVTRRGVSYRNNNINHESSYRRRIYLSSASVVVAPSNLLQQWKDEIRKHTSGLKVLVLEKTADKVPSSRSLTAYDLILFSQTRFEHLENQGWRCETTRKLLTPLSHVHFKRIIVDEGHRIGNSRISSRSKLLTVADSLICSARWIVTGTPSDGLYGVEDSDGDISMTGTSEAEERGPNPQRKKQRETTTATGGTGRGKGSKASSKPRHQASANQEAADLTKLGNIASMYLRARPWASEPSSSLDVDGGPASWKTYVLLPHHSPRSLGTEATLKRALRSLIIRHPLKSIRKLLPSIEEKVVVLEGSYQDKLALNLFSSMIIANAVQSQRKDQDYFFNPKQKGAVTELVKNLKQASFFGGSFFGRKDVENALGLAEEFLRKEGEKVEAERVPGPDVKLLQEAMDFMRLVLENEVREASSIFHELPLAVERFPGPHGAEWALDGKVHTSRPSVTSDAPSSPAVSSGEDGQDAEAQAERERDIVILCAPLIARLKTCTRKYHNQMNGRDPTALATYLNGEIVEDAKRAKYECAQMRSSHQSLEGRKKNGNNNNNNKGRSGGDDSAAKGDASSSSSASAKIKNTSIVNTGEDSHSAFRRTQKKKTPGKLEQDALMQGTWSSSRSQPSSASGPRRRPQADVTTVPPALRKTKIVATASAKLSYLVDAIAQHQGAEKILVFYEDDNAAFYLASALEVMGVGHLIYARGASLTASRRARYVAAFNRTPALRVLLMDTSLAAFGLDMRAASRIYFVSPVLNPQVEAQAIGRARRISQGLDLLGSSRSSSSSPGEEEDQARDRGGEEISPPPRTVHVETLVLKDSLEEVVVERKGTMTREEHRRCKTILDVGPVREWVLGSRIIPLGTSGAGAPAEEPPVEAQLAPLAAPQSVFRREHGAEAGGRGGHAQAEAAARRRGPGREKSNAGRPAEAAGKKRARFGGLDDEQEDEEVDARKKQKKAVDVVRFAGGGVATVG
ncbi:hypothetical protein MKZ38_000392 [Zalerion maritima]|uniref:Helicase C-terminal domain-containing protein n=1 Tax=Zalerion maritima TaxID=339359 RepID=A0AAD5WU18_9PEZI|nr:hypothetical protein MKZ38_000392 [Zalerion maritima]